MELKHYIKLDTEVYQVRRRGDAREIFAFGEWLAVSDFVMRLYEGGYLSQLEEITKAGMVLLPDKEMIRQAQEWLREQRQ